MSEQHVKQSTIELKVLKFFVQHDETYEGEVKAWEMVKTPVKLIQASVDNDLNETNMNNSSVDQKKGHQN